MSCKLPGYESAAPAEQDKALREIFQRLFSTDDGKIVFNALLFDLHFFTEATAASDQALADYAKFFLRERMGITDTFAITNALVKTIDSRKD